MKKDEITRLFQILAMNENDREEFWIELEAQNFADAIDE